MVILFSNNKSVNLSNGPAAIKLIVNIEPAGLPHSHLGYELGPAVRVPNGELNVSVVCSQLIRRVLEVVLRPEPHSGDRMPSPVT